MPRVSGPRRTATPRAIASRKRAPNGSRLEATLALQIRAARLPEPEREVCLIPDRKLRFDFVWREQRLAVEVQGAEWANGKYNRAPGMTDACTKAALALLQGYRTMEVTGTMVRNGRALSLIESALLQRPEHYGPKT